MKVSVCIASRGRPALFRQTIDILIAGMALSETVISAALDAGDDTLGDYPTKEEPPRYLRSIGPREDSLGAKWNRAQMQVPADLYVLWADDMVMPDKGWDKALVAAAAALPDQCGAVFFGDIPGVLQPGIAVTQKFVDAMGFFAPPYFPFSWWSDTWCLEMATMSGRGVHADVRVTLLDSLKGSSRGIRDVLFWAGFFDAFRPSRAAAAERIIREGSESPERKAGLLSQIPDWVNRWTYSNSVLRDPKRAAELETHYSFDAPADERYARLKARAEDMLKVMA